MTEATYVTGGTDTRTAPAGAQVRLWREHVTDNHGQLELGFRNSGDSFAGGTRVQRYGGLQLVEFWSDPVAYERRAEAADRDGDDSLRLLVPLSGELRVAAAGAVRRLDPSGAAAVSMERGFRLEQDRRARAFVLTLPRHLWPGTTPGEPAVWDVDRGDGAVFAAMIRAVAAQHGSLDAHSFVRACEAAAMILPRGGSDLHTHARALVRQHADAIGFGPPELAARLGWSLRSLQLALRRSGTTPAELIRQHRLESAAARLTDPRWQERTISHIAHASGFGSLTAFNTSFRARFGRSPSEMRNGVPTAGPE